MGRRHIANGPFRFIRIGEDQYSVEHRDSGYYLGIVKGPLRHRRTYGYDIWQAFLGRGAQMVDDHVSEHTTREKAAGALLRYAVERLASSIDST